MTDHNCIEIIFVEYKAALSPMTTKDKLSSLYAAQISIEARIYTPI